MKTCMFGRVVVSQAPSLSQELLFSLAIPQSLGPASLSPGSRSWGSSDLNFDDSAPDPGNVPPRQACEALTSAPTPETPAQSSPSWLRFR